MVTLYINKLYSENNIFHEIKFHDGLNIILGEKYDNSTIRGRKTNSVGKSMSIEFRNWKRRNYDKAKPKEF